jgi:hypothetical protein
VLGYSRSGFYHACSPTPTQIADEQVGLRGNFIPVTRFNSVS